MTEGIHIEQFVVGPVQTNCYFLINQRTKEVIIVDPGDEAPRLIGEVTRLGIAPVAILLTHGHFDHVGAAGKLASYYQVKVYAHEAEEKTLSDSNVNLSGPMLGRPASYHADVFLHDEEEITLAGCPVRVLFTPGHTAGGCCYYLAKEDLVFSGDSLFCGSIGRTDFPGGSARTLVESVRTKLMGLPEQTLVLPGHDASTTIGEERMYNPYL